MGAIHVHEFMSLDGVIDAPTWTFDTASIPRMGEAIAAVTGRCRGILLGRTTFEMFEPAWPTRTARTIRGRRSSTTPPSTSSPGRWRTATWRNSEIVGPYDPEAIRA